MDAEFWHKIWEANEFYNFKLMEVIKPKAFTKLDMSEIIWLLSPREI